MKRAIVLLVTIPLVWILFHFLSGGAVLTPGNMVNLFKYLAVVGMLAVGMTWVIGAGFIDLSVGSLLGFLGALNALLLQSGWPLWGALALSALIAIAAGSLHGFLVAWLRVPAFIATLSGLLAYMGLKQWIANPVIPIRNETLLLMGQGFLRGIPSYALAVTASAIVLFIYRKKLGIAMPIAGILWAMVLVSQRDRGLPFCVLALTGAAVSTHFLSTQTRQGRYVFALGSNPEAARYAGIPIRGITILVFAVMGLMAWLAGLTATSQLMAGAADIGDYQELYAIAACVLGGTSLRGGTGNVWMSILGAVLMASILNGMEQMGITSTVQKVILGIILTAAVAADQAAGRRR